MRSSPISSDQEPAPDSRSTPAIRRALLGPFAITRTMLVAPVASFSTRATCARGKPPGAGKEGEGAAHRADYLFVGLVQKRTVFDADDILAV